VTTEKLRFLTKLKLILNYLWSIEIINAFLKVFITAVMQL